jgi:hypothetical protein
MSAVTIGVAIVGYLALAGVLTGVILAAADTGTGALALDILRG